MFSAISGEICIDINIYESKCSIWYGSRTYIWILPALGQKFAIEFIYINYDPMQFYIYM